MEVEVACVLVVDVGESLSGSTLPSVFCLRGLKPEGQIRIELDNT